MTDENANVEEQTNTETTMDVETQNDTTLLTEDSESEEGLTPKEGEEGKDQNEEKKVQEDNAPENYADYELPEGVSIDKGMLENFNKVAKELNLSQAKAQKMINVAIEHTKSMAQQNNEAFRKTREHWVSELKNDKDFGGEKFNATIGNARKVLKKFGSNELNSFLIKSGVGDNNEVIKFLARIGARIGEDTAVDGNPAAQPKSAAEIIYPNSN